MAKTSPMPWPMPWLDALADAPADRSRGVGLRQQQRHDPQCAEADGRDHVEDHPPAEERRQRAPRKGGEKRRHAEDEHGGGHEPRGLHAGMEVANDRARDHHGGAGPHALEEPEGDQGFRAAGEAAPDAPEDEQDQADIERRLAAESVGQGAVDDLADGHRSEEAGQAHLHGADIRPEVAGDRREGRKVHVDGEGSDGGQDAEHERVAQERGAGWRTHGHGTIRIRRAPERTRLEPSPEGCGGGRWNQGWRQAAPTRADGRHIMPCPPGVKTEVEVGWSLVRQHVPCLRGHRGFIECPASLHPRERRPVPSSLHASLTISGHVSLGNRFGRRDFPSLRSATSSFRAGPGRLPLIESPNP